MECVSHAGCNPLKDYNRLLFYIVETVYRTNYLTGIAQSHHVGRYIPGDHTSGSYNGSVADTYTGQDGDVGGQPYVMAYGDGAGTHDSRIPLFGM